MGTLKKHFVGVNFTNGLTVTTPPAWTPTSLGSALALWFDAESSTLASGRVASLADLSGNGYTATQATTSKQPLFTPAVSGTSRASFGTDNFSSHEILSSAGACAKLALDFNQPWWLYVAFKANTQQSYEDLLAYCDDNFLGWAIELGNSVGAKPALRYCTEGAGSRITVSTTTALTPGQSYTLGMAYDGSQSASGVRLWLNGVLETPIILESSLASGTSVIGSGQTLKYFYGVDGINDCASSLYSGLVASGVPSSGDLAHAEAYCNRSPAVHS